MPQEGRVCGNASVLAAEPATRPSHVFVLAESRIQRSAFFDRWTSFALCHSLDLLFCCHQFAWRYCDCTVPSFVGSAWKHELFKANEWQMR